MLRIVERDPVCDFHEYLCCTFGTCTLHARHFVMLFQAKGHEKVAKSLRSRLGLPSGRPDSARQGGDHTGAASLSTQQQRQEKEKDEEEEDKEIWASIADLA